jgi:translation initiation factor IF-2
MRIHEFAKKLNLSSKELIQELKKYGMNAKSHMELISSEVLEKAEKAYASKSAVSVKAAVPTVEVKTKSSSKKVEPKPAAAKKEEIKKEEQKVVPATSAPKFETKEPVKKEEIKKETPTAAVVTAIHKVEETKKEIKAAEIKPALAPKDQVEKTPTISSAKPVQVSAPEKLPQAPAAEVKKPAIKVEIPITVGALAEKICVRIPELIKSLISFGVFASINQLLNEEIVYKVANTLGIKIEKDEDEAEKLVLKDSDDDLSQLKTRFPVVTMMGHVDHGKTSLLDAIRQSNVAGGEVGQITQHIGAYVVDIKDKGHVTFLDTPGHAAFTAMRARGANVTDIVVLVVAADDGVMPQTIEAVDHARAAGCPIVVAMNKCDLPAANPERVMAELQKMDLVPEEWGGKTICVKVSAKTGKGIDELLDLLLLEAEVLELKANPNRPAQGTVIEAKLTKGQGPIANLIVQKGTLHLGDLVVAGPHYGKVRALRNDKGKSVKEAGPSFAVELLGLSGAPEAGEVFCVINDEKVARKIAEKRELEARERAMKGLHPKHLSLEELYSQVQEGKVKELKLIIKADVQGSIEALSRSLEQVVSEKIKVRILHGAVGGINESDIMLAAASDAVVIGFHVKMDERAGTLAEKEGVDVRIYRIIYEAVDDVKKAMEGLLEPTVKEIIEGRTEIRKVFESSKVGAIGGAFVLKGKIVRSQPVRVVRNNIIVHEGRLASLKRFQDDVREVAEGYDCGVVVEGFGHLKEGDIVESFRIEKTAGKLV